MNSMRILLKAKGGFMATLSNQRVNYIFEDFPNSRISYWAVPIGRFFYSFIFIMSGFNHFTSGSISYADSMGIPLADILVPISGLIAIAGGISVLLGLHARFGALLLLVFLVPVTILMHQFWIYEDPQVAQMQMIHFLKNTSLIGTAILIAFYGSGPISFDNRKARKS